MSNPKVWSIHAAGHFRDELLPTFGLRLGGRPYRMIAILEKGQDLECAEELEY